MLTCMYIITIFVLTVSAKIRLLDSMDETVEFMRGLEAAGAHGITGTTFMIYI